MKSSMSDVRTQKKKNTGYQPCNETENWPHSAQVPKTTLHLASNPTPVAWNHSHGQQYPQPSHKPPPQQRDKQNKIRQHKHGHSERHSVEADQNKLK